MRCPSTFTLAAEQKFTEALKLYDEALRIDTRNEEALLQRGHANLKARRIKKVLPGPGVATETAAAGAETTAIPAPAPVPSV